MKKLSQRNRFFLYTHKKQINIFSESGANKVFFLRQRKEGRKDVNNPRCR